MKLWLSESHGEEEEDAEDDDEDDEVDEVEEAEEDNDRRYNLRQRKTLQRYEAPPIGDCFQIIQTPHFHLVNVYKVRCLLPRVCLLRACEQKAEQPVTF